MVGRTGVDPNTLGVFLEAPCKYFPSNFVALST
jgi:hypothetical protein